LVRSFAVETLDGAKDEEIILYLLQLVQALKYEGMVGREVEKKVGGEEQGGVGGEGKGGVEKDDEKVGALGKFLITRACRNLELANYLYWYLKVETEDAFYGGKYTAVLKALEEGLKTTPLRPPPQNSGGRISAAAGDDDDELSESSAPTDSTPSGKRKTGSKNVFTSIIKGVQKATGTPTGKDAGRGAFGEAGGAESDDEIDDNESTASVTTAATTSTTASNNFTFYDVFEAQETFFLGIMLQQVRERSGRTYEDAVQARLVA